MVLDIDTFDEPDGSNDFRVQGETLTLYWTAPDDVDVLEVSREAREFRRKQIEHRQQHGGTIEKIEQLQEDLEELDADSDAAAERREEIEQLHLEAELDVGDAEIEPVVDFVRRHIVEADGLASGDEEATWGECDRSVQDKILRSDFNALIRTYADMQAVTGLDEDEKNG